VTGRGTDLKPRPAIPTNESQKRSVATSLALLDETLCLFEEYARGREVHSICYEERNRLTADQRKILLRQIEAVRDHMRQIKDDLGLGTRVEDVGNRIWGQGVGFWEMLAEMQSKHLKGYGKVDPALAEYLDLKAEQLLEQLQAISGIAGARNEKA